MTELNHDLEKDYLEASVLANQVASEMISRLQWVMLKPDNILLVGFGTQFCKALLTERYPNATIVEIDYLNALLTTGWGRLDNKRGEPILEKVDLIMANLFLPWCEDWEFALFQWKSLLKPDGLLMFSALGPDTLKELNTEELIPHLMDMHDLGDALVKYGFSDPVMDAEQFTLQYSSIDKLTHELTLTGMLSTRLKPHFAPQLTYEIVYAHTWGQSPAQSNSEGEVKIPISLIKGRKS